MNPGRHSRSVGRVRHERAVARARGKQRRLGRVPRAKPPTAIALSYYRAIKPIVTRAAAHLRAVLPEILELLADRREQLEAEKRVDADGPMGAAGKARGLVRLAASRAAEAYRPAEVERAAERWGQETDEHARRELHAQVRAAVGVDISSLETRTRDRIPAFARENARLVGGIPEDYYERVERVVLEAFERGTHPDDMVDDLREVLEISERDAARVARDQVGKLAAQVSVDRQQALGVERGVWRGALDNRECDECRALEGQSFDLSSGIDGILPGFCHPGDRCWTEPDFSGIVEGLGSDED